MGAESTILAKYRPRGFTKGTELLLGKSDALDFIEDCERLGLTILGLNFYEGPEPNVTETLAPADYSSLSGQPDRVARSARAARELIGGGLVDGARWVSFVVEE